MALALKEKYDFLTFTDFVTVENNIYISNQTFNALVICDKNNLNIKDIITFVDIDVAKQFIHRLCVKKGSFIYFLSNKNGGFHRYNYATKKLSFFKIVNCEYYSRVSIGYAHIYENKLYVLPYRSQINAFSWDLKSDFVKVEEWWKFDKEEFKDYLQHGTLSEHEIFTLYGMTSNLIVTNISEKKIDEYVLPDQRVRRICYDGKNFWYILQDKTDIVQWSIKNGTILRFEFSEWSYGSDSGVPYQNICVAQNRIFLISGNGKAIFVLDKENRTLTKVFDIPVSARRIYEGNFPNFKVMDNSLIIMFEFSSLIIKIDLESLEILEFDTTVIHSDLFSLHVTNLLKELTRNFIEMESESVSIKYLIEISEFSNVFCGKENLKKNAGVEIYNLLNHL